MFKPNVIKLEDKLPKKHPNDWSDEELEVFENIEAVRTVYGRECKGDADISEDGNPIWVLYSTDNGIPIFFIVRGPKNIGYHVFGPSRTPAYVRSLKELQEGYAFMERKNYSPELINSTSQGEF